MFFSIEIHSMQDWIAPKRHAVTRKRRTKRWNAFRKAV